MQHSGIKLAVGFLVIGVLFIIVNVVMLTTGNYYFPKLLIGGIISVFLSFGMFIAPGENIPIENNNQFFQQLWKTSTTKDKIIWLLSVVAGIAATFVTSKYLGLNFFD